jgi:hypothetical protein
MGASSATFVFNAPLLPRCALPLHGGGHNCSIVMIPNKQTQKLFFLSFPPGWRGALPVFSRRGGVNHCEKSESLRRVARA